MARYTVELGEIVKSGLQVFDFPYAFYDDAKKADFQQKFIDHFYFREIGQETVGRFQHYLKIKFNEVLPYYNEVLRVALMKYELLDNYNLTETFTKTSTATKNATDTANQNGTSGKANTLDSETTHTEVNNITRNEDVSESGALNKSTTEDTYNKKVESDTPNGLLAMSDIKNNVYASKAGIEDLTNVTDDTQTNTAEKTSSSSETTSATVTDKVDASSQDSETFENETTAAHNENVNGEESYVLSRIGNIGVDTASDMLKKHLEFQKNVQTAYMQFFNECEDLFMQIY